MEESCCQSSLRLDRSQRRRAAGWPDGWGTRLGKWERTKAATDSRWRLKPKQISSSSEMSWKLAGYCSGTKSWRNWQTWGGQSGQKTPPESLALNWERFCSQRVLSL